jgi:hypothetical protein
MESKTIGTVERKEEGEEVDEHEKKRDSVSCIRVYKARRQRSGGGSDANKGSKERGKDR